MSAVEPHEPKQYLVERVRGVLAQDPRVGELDIHIKVVGDRVFVRGTVSTPQRRDVITSVLEEQLPDYDLVNELSVPEMVERIEKEELS